jgi:hypothetical protein
MLQNRPPSERARHLLGRIAAFAVPLAAAAAMIAFPAAAARPQAIRIDMAGALTGPNSVSGTWSASGAVADGGTYTETFRIVGNTIHGEKILVGRKGTIVLDVRGLVVPTSACTVTFAAGSWRVVTGSAAYESMRGEGEPVVEPGSFGDLCTGAVRVSHAGRASVDAGDD